MSDNRRDAWDLFTLGLWFPFFLVGLVPELAFYLIREWGAVPPYTALVNSSAVITLSFAAYVAFFALRRCRDAGLSRPMAQGKALEIGLLALVAFLEIPTKGMAFQARTLIGVLLDIQQLPDRYLQLVVFLVGTTKLVAWAYLFSLVIRYHAFGNRRVFAQIPSMFPSMHATGRGHERGPRTSADDAARSDDGHTMPVRGHASDAEEAHTPAERGIAGK